MGHRQTADEHGGFVGPAQRGGHVLVQGQGLDGGQHGEAGVLAPGGGLQHRGQGAGQFRRRDHALAGQGVVELEIDGVDRHHLGAGQGGLAQAMVEQGLILAREAPHHQDRFQLLRLSQGQTQAGPERRGVLVDEIGLPQAMVDVAHPQAPQELLGQVQFLGGGGRGRQGAQVRLEPVGAGQGRLQPLLDKIQGGVPSHFPPVAVQLDHGGLQPVRRVQALVAEAVPV